MSLNSVKRYLLFGKFPSKIYTVVLRNQYNINLKTDEYDLLQKYESKIIFNSFIEKKRLKLGYKRNVILTQKLQKSFQHRLNELESVQPLPVYLENKNEFDKPAADEIVSNCNQSRIIHFPYGDVDAEILESNSNRDKPNQNSQAEDDVINEIKRRQELMKKGWMAAYENYEDDFKEESIDTSINYGTPDPDSKISNFPCGGCGALLHCKDTAIPGYIPSEIYKHLEKRNGVIDSSVICQRCYFLKEFNTALQVRVAAEQYPKVLETIRDRKALILLIVDLLDFPCSIWPGITELVGKKKPIIIVGNKADLLPADSGSYLDRIKTVLLETVKQKGLENSNIVGTSLISAVTGWGIEELITKMHNVWGTRGDVYLVGCTNVGKSSLFNTLLQSDFCKVKASDLIQRATTSCWPGTTLNLLKFPILRPSGWRLFVRTKRLQSLRKIAAQEEKLRKAQLKKTGNPRYATLIGHIDRTFASEESSNESKDIFSMGGIGNVSKGRKGINEKDPEYVFSKWCYDTPGVVQQDQIIHLLTTEELTRVLPKQLISPQSFRIQLNSSIFLGGIARLDYIEGPDKIIITVFCSHHLPLTVCETQYASEIYQAFLGSDYFSVPEGDSARLKKWPNLKTCDCLTLEGINWDISCGDIVLSNAGWVSITCGSKSKLTFKAWTPEARGIYLRNSILPYAVTLRGEKIRKSVAYKSHKLFVK